MTETPQFDNFDDWKEADEALSRAVDALLKGTPAFKHIRPEDEVNVIKAGWWYRRHAEALAKRVIAAEAELYKTGEVSMSLGEPKTP